jgi:hypothetical protein
MYQLLNSMLQLFFVCVFDDMYSGEYNVFDVTLRYFSACPVWIYTQSNIKNIILSMPQIMHLIKT